MDVSKLERDFNFFYNNIDTLSKFNINQQYLFIDKEKVLQIRSKNKINKLFRMKHKRLYHFLRYYLNDYTLFIDKLIYAFNASQERVLRIFSLSRQKLEKLKESLKAIENYYRRKNFINTDYLQLVLFIKRICENIDIQMKEMDSKISKS